ncbi:hypothetical protein ASE74_03690 [Pedobacter sp. Leaf216]|uniref:DUF4270 domain-containing protein n=1 Tax=Pedobacter sp. Leaf216 TaxID=1735684 RepID=UPI00070074A7|nr:DUF4270 domain-containing protein [Pedobacter sp. Leaf216]KQM75086.1 hypothetical protein ASE74_03690 [Pedobacter sp. Leaf216]
MKFTKQDLLTLLIGLFLFASCKNPDGVGLDVDPNTAITGTLVVSPVKSQLVPETAANTFGLNRYPLGYMTDPVFGKTEASLAMTVYPVVSTDFGTSPTLDSAVLVLKLDESSTATKFYGDTTNSKYSIDVYQLANKVENYKSSDVQTFNNALLGNFTGKIAPNTKAKIFDIVTGKADTLKTVPAQIRIPLNKAFIQNNILNLGTTGTASNAKFIDAFKGLYAQINKTSSTGVGGIAFFNFTGTDSYLQLVWKKVNSSSGIDTATVNFPIGVLVSNGSSGTSVISGVAANIKHDYAGTPVQEQISAPAASYNVTYLQGLAGVKTKLSFPDLTSFTNLYGKAIVNKAELVVELGGGAPAYPFNAAQRLSLYRWDIAQQPVSIPDYTTFTSSTGGDALFGGYFDALKNRYIFIVTSYVQGLIDKTTEDNGTFLAPTSFNNFQVVPTATSAERSIIGATNLTTNKLKLNIYYTKIN